MLNGANITLPFENTECGRLRLGGGTDQASDEHNSPQAEKVEGIWHFRIRTWEAILATIESTKEKVCRDYGRPEVE
jgi:hypothetical protein